MTDVEKREKEREPEQMAQALRDSQAHLSRIVASAMDAMIIVDDRQCITLFNRAAERMFGYPAAEVIGRPLDILIPETARERHRGHIEHFGRTGQTSRSIGRLGTLFGLRAGGEVFPMEASISRVDVSDGTFFTAILRDVTERVQAEEALRARNDEITTITQQLWQAARLATMGELAASIAHELNNPLAILSLRIESLLLVAPETSPMRPELAVMEREVERMAALVANLLQFSRATGRQVSSLAITDEIDQTLDLVQSYLSNRQVEARTEVAPGVGMIQADRQQIRQLLLNLVTNAADAMPEGGLLRICVEPALLGAAHEAGVRLTVADTGDGIAPEDLSSVMEPFFTTKPDGKGTGLGLAICRRIVEDHGGEIEVWSAGRGQGAQVRVTLPAASASPPNFLDE